MDDYTRFRYIADLQEAILANRDATLAAGLADCLRATSGAGTHEQVAAILAEARAISLGVQMVPG